MGEARAAAKAVCGGTLGWKDPPFNPILALPGATHQDLTQNDIINDLNSQKINFNYIKINLIMTKNIIKITLLSYKSNETLITISNYMPLSCKNAEKGQATHQLKLRCHIFWHKNKMCREVNDISLYRKENEIRLSVKSRHIYSKCEPKSINWRHRETLNQISSEKKPEPGKNDTKLHNIINNETKINEIATHYVRKFHEIKQKIYCLFWHKNKLCHACNDSWISFINHVIRQAASRHTKLISYLPVRNDIDISLVNVKYDKRHFGGRNRLTFAEYLRQDQPDLLALASSPKLLPIVYRSIEKNDIKDYQNHFCQKKSRGHEGPRTHAYPIPKEGGRPSTTALRTRYINELHKYK